jgi:hypothetical protein
VRTADSLGVRGISGVIGGIKVAASGPRLIFLLYGIANTRRLGDASCFSVSVCVLKDLLLVGHHASSLS